MMYLKIGVSLGVSGSVSVGDDEYNTKRLLYKATPLCKYRIVCKHPIDKNRVNPF